MRIALLLALLAALSAARAEDLDGSFMLVARRGVADPLYGSSVLVVRSLPGGMHVGFIMNKPTKLTPAQVLPADEPSRKIAGPVLLGGPTDVEMMFALVAQPPAPSDDMFRMTDDLFVAATADAVHRLAAEDPGRLRFVMGTVVWRPGELAGEVERGMWHVADPEPDLATRRSLEHLWDDYVGRIERRASMI